LKIGDQRPAREIEQLQPKIQKITPQRLRNVPLTVGNVARIFATRTLPTETGLAGWGAWIRTREWRNQNPSGSRYLSIGIPKKCGNSTSIRSKG
jgi:hypothetical protein